MILVILDGLDPPDFLLEQNRPSESESLTGGSFSLSLFWSLPSDWIKLNRVINGQDVQSSVFDPLLCVSHLRSPSSFLLSVFVV